MHYGDRDNNATPAIIMILEYNHCNENNHISDNYVPAGNMASHLRNAWTAVDPREPHFRGQEENMSNRLHESE